MTAIHNSTNVLGTLITGALRIAPLISGGIVVVLTGVVALRIIKTMLTTLLSLVVELEKPKQGSENNVLPKMIREIMPDAVKSMFDSLNKTDTLPLIGTILKVAAFTIVLTEFVRLIGGAPHPIYNNVLAFLGPYRISPDSYLDGVRVGLRAAGIQV